MLADKFAGRDLGNIKINGSGRMVLNPLAEVVLGVFMAVGIGGGQFVMDVLRHGKRRKDQQQGNQADGESGPPWMEKLMARSRESH